MIFKADLSSVDGIQIALSAEASMGRQAPTPSLAGYSPVPSMQMVATQHSSAIVGSSGCSVVVSAAIDAEIQWSAANLKSMVTALESHEMDTGAAFELGVNKRFAVLTILGSIVLTAALWVYLLGSRA